MIKRLRIKFVVMNMSIIAMLLITILGLVFYFTRLNLETESINMIRNIAQNPFILKNPNEIS
ncbi:MAG: sensor histidine kinase, partial [Hungatella sp.]